MAGRDLMACGLTGCGKMEAFCLPIWSCEGETVRTIDVGPWWTKGCVLALILSPTRSSSCKIHKEAEIYSRGTGVKVVVACVGIPTFLQIRRLEEGVHILVATPQRLVNLIKGSRVSLGMIKYLVLDEVDRMIYMGLEPQIRKIVERMGMPPAGVRQTLLFSSTCPTEIQRLASDILSNHISLAFRRVGDLIAENVFFTFMEYKIIDLKVILHIDKLDSYHSKNAPTLVFVETKEGADEVHEDLCTSGFKATKLLGGMDGSERADALNDSRKLKSRIMVVTDYVRRGLVRIFGVNMQGVLIPMFTGLD